MKSTAGTDTERLRADLKDYYGTGAFAGMPAMMTKVWDIDRKSDREVTDLARREGFDLHKYRK